MKAGTLRHRVRLLSPTSTSDSFGQPIETYTTSGYRWAKVEELPAGEQQINDGTTNKVRIKVTVRALGTKIISARSRIEYAGAQYAVVSVIDPTGEGIMLEVIAEGGD